MPVCCNIKHRVCGTFLGLDVGLSCAEYDVLQNGLPIIEWQEIVEDDLGVEGVEVMLCFIVSLASVHSYKNFRLDNTLSQSILKKIWEKIIATLHSHGDTLSDMPT